MTNQYRNKTRRWLWVGAVTTLILFFFLIQMQSVGAAPDQNVYIDSLTSGWQNWSWDSTLNFSNTNPVKEGANALSVQYTAAWAGLYLRASSPMSTSGLDTLRFWLHGGSSGNQSILVKTVNGSEGWSGDYFITASPNQWVLYEIPLANLGSPGSLLGLVFQNPNNGSQPVFYLDSIAVVNSGSPTTTPAPTSVPGSGPTLTINANEGQHPISPEIYGMNFPDTTLARELQLPVARWGGNATTRYNWQLDVSNRAHDWYYENIANDVANLSALPYGTSSDRFVADNQQANSETLMTIPMIGWTPKSRNKDCGFSVSKYGSQQSTDPWAPDCGNGIKSNGSEITSNDPADTSIAIDEAFVQAWMQHLISQYGKASQGGVKYYNLDNEPMLWSATHRDVHAAPVSYDEIRDLTYRYGAAVKAADPTAQTLGPVVWGWSAYFYSAADGDWWLGAPDRNAHGGMAFLPWYLDQMKQYEQAHGVRILDYLDIHYYPQQSGVALQQAGSSATQELRLRSTRALWDNSYVDESWINEPVYLIPRMQEWIDSYYPGTKLAISEYNWGGLEHINGALTQAEVLGLFGREGVDLATIWDPPAANQPGAYAFRMYLNYDGNNGRFGDTSIYANSNDQSKVAIYGSVRSSDGALMLIIINKTKSAVTSPVALNSFSSNGQAEVYRYSSANLNAIVRDGNVNVSGNTLNAYLPAESISLFVLPTGTAVPPTATASPTPQPTATNTPVPTATNTPGATATNTPVPTATNTPVPTATNTPAPTATAVAPSCNLLQNGSFEDGTNSWNTSGSASPVSDAYDGSAAVMLGRRPASLFQTTPATAGSSYTISGWFKASGNPSPISLSVEFLNGSGSVVGSASVSLNRDGAYTNYALSRTAPSGTTQARVTIDQSGSKGNLYADLMKLEMAGECGSQPPPTATTIAPTAVPPTPTNTPVPNDGTVHVSNLTGSAAPGSRNGRWDASITMTVADANGQPVSGATVAGSWSNGANGSDSCLTDSNGQCSVSKQSLRSSSVTWTVTGISHPSYSYDAAANNMTAITLATPLANDARYDK